MYTEEQKNIIAHDSGHALVIAGPGTGKTTTMIGRIESLVANGYKPSEMLILMFNKSAKDEFASKLSDRIGNPSLVPEVRTYHSLAKVILEALERKKIVEKHTLETSEKRRQLMALDIIRKRIGNHRLNEIQKGQDKIIEDFLSFVDLIKANLLSPKEAFDAYVDDNDLDFFLTCFDDFEDDRQLKKIRFFSDLLSDLAYVIMRNDYVREWLSNKKTQIIVDEYQDTNLSQQLILKTIAGTKASVMAVGDVDQSIYEWRGGTPELMLYQFEKDFPETERFTLSNSFRFGDKLADAAYKLISKNRDRFETKCISHPNNPDTEISTISNERPGKAVADKIIDLKGMGINLNKAIILVRLYSAGLPVELELISRGVPVSIDNGSSCFLSKEYKNIVFLLRFAGIDSDLSQDEIREGVANLLTFPHIGLPANMIADIANKAAHKRINQLPSLLLQYASTLKIPFQKHKVKSRARALQVILDMACMGADSDRIIKTYQRETELYSSLEKLSLKETEATETIDRCKSLISFIEGKGSPKNSIEWLESLNQKRIELSQENEKVKISSIHKSKGLEYDFVFLTGLEDGRFPYEKDSSRSSGQEVESERRLFYVGMTRAIRSLYLDVPYCPVFFNTSRDISQKTIVSRFVEEIS